MSKFVELTQAQNREPVFVNPNLVATVVNVPEKPNVVYVKIEDKYGFEVIGTADEIVSQLEGGLDDSGIKLRRVSSRNN